MMDDLDAVTFLVLMRLSAFADHRTGENARPAAQTLADLLKISVTTVRKALRKGITLGYLTKEERRHDDKTSEPSVYKCLWIKPLMDEQSKKGNDIYLSPSRQGRCRPRDTNHPHITKPKTPRQRRADVAVLVDGWNGCGAVRRAVVPAVGRPLHRVFLHDWNRVDGAEIVAGFKVAAPTGAALTDVLAELWGKYGGSDG